MSHVIFEYSPELAARISAAVNTVLGGDIHLAAVCAGASVDLMKQLVDDQWEGGNHFAVQRIFLDATCCSDYWFRTGDSDVALTSPAIRIVEKKDGNIEVLLRAGVTERGDIMTVQRYNAIRGEDTGWPNSFWKLWKHIGDTSVFHGRL